MDKQYLTANDYLTDTWRLADQIRRAPWQPTFILALWRGGAPVGVAVHEFLKVTGWSCRHLAIKCSSYTGIGTSDTKVTFDCAEEAIAAIHKGERVLVVDDVFDTGRTSAAVRERLLQLGAEPRIACVYWKPQANCTQQQPDYFVRQVDSWLVFPHELEGLTPTELRTKNPQLANLLTPWLT